MIYVQDRKRLTKKQTTLSSIIHGKKFTQQKYVFAHTFPIRNLISSSHIINGSYQWELLFIVTNE